MPDPRERAAATVAEPVTPGAGSGTGETVPVILE